MSVLFSSCAVLSKIWNNMWSIYRNIVLVKKLSSSHRNFSSLNFVWIVSFCDGDWSDIFENNILAEERIDMDLT